ncbi:MAG: methyltransferase domain-containing protein [Pseudobdellovibrio sp.]
MSKKSSLADGYIHGFSSNEQDRLYQQARVHEEIVFSQIDFSTFDTVLEVGSGVGAQTQILLERFPQLKISCVDASSTQVDRAKKTLKDKILSGQVNIQVGDAMDLQFDDDMFDGAFVCWLLEHVQNPIGILKEIKRVLKANGTIYCNEVFNSTFYCHPYSPSTLKFWFEFNDFQYSLKGDPFVGGKLANYLLAAGYQNVSTKVLTHQYDNRTPKKRAQFIDYWAGLLLSGAENLISTGRVTEELVEEMKRELNQLKKTEDSVIFYSWILARGQVF